MVARPLKRIEVLAADGHTRVPLYPDDVKALATQLWAEAYAPTRFIGRRCDVENPEVDASGRAIDPECNDTNPGTWHLAVVNQIGVARRSFVIDATYDYQVWNQPVLGYAYSYVNPKAEELAPTLAEATVKLADWPADPRRGFHSARAVALVGIQMRLTYMAETSPSRSPIDDESRDRRIDTHLRYDLELDAQGNIVGGEWRGDTHPDFLWTPTPGARARAQGDRALDQAGDAASWSGTAPVPVAWRKVAPASSRGGEPLARVVEALAALARIP
jgi:hypothetical protein